jgi:hypothetical protein
LLAAYLLIGLGWIALVRKREMEEQAFRRPARQLDVAWLALLGTMSAAMVGAVALVSFSGSGLLLGLLRIVAVIAAAVWQAGLYVAANWLGPALAWLFGLLHFGGVRTSSSGSLFGRRPQPGRNVDAIILAWLQKHLPVPVLLALLLVMFAIMLSVWLAMRFRMWRTEAEDEERTSVWSWRLFLSQLRQLLRQIRPSFRAAAAAGRLARQAPEPPISTARQLYTAVLRWCREHERPRPPAATPFEFESALSDETEAALAHDLTAAYVRTRYAEAEPPPAEVSRLKEQWENFLAQPSPATAGEGRVRVPGGDEPGL